MPEFFKVAVVTRSTAQHFTRTSSGADILTAQSQLRYHVLKNSGWEALRLDHVLQKEEDKFDTEKTVYFITRKENGDIFGTVRINPTTSPYMLQETCFDGLFEDKRNQDIRSAFVENKHDLVTDRRVWEGSRAVFDLDSTKEERRTALSSLTLAKAEFMRVANIENCIGMMPQKVWQSVFANNGWTVEPLGQEVVFPDRSFAQAARYWIEDESYEHARRKLGLKKAESLLRWNDADHSPITYDDLAI